MSVDEAIALIDRKEFLPADFADTDPNIPVPIGPGQTVPTAAITKLFLDLLELKRDDLVVEIGTGSGYQSAIMAQLAREVHTVEVREIATGLKDILPSNVYLYHRNGLTDPPEVKADKMIITCGVPFFLWKWLEIMKPEAIAVVPIMLDGGGCAVRKYVRDVYQMRDCGDFAYADFVLAEMPVILPIEARCR